MRRYESVMFVPDGVNGECWREETGRGEAVTWGRETMGLGRFDWVIVVWGVGILLVFCLIIYIYFMVYIGGHRFV